MDGFQDKRAKILALLGAAAALTFVYLLYKIMHSLYFGGLSHIPGPKLNALSMIPYARHMLAGSTVENTVRLHKKYGDAVRIGPKEVSFISGETAFPDIYGFRTGKLKGHLNMYKDPAWYVKPENGVPSILHADDEDHSRGRRVLAHAFSEKAVTAQEPLVQGYVDQLVGRLREVAAQGHGPVDMVKWYNWTTFDVIADLMFGEPFGCLQDLSTHGIVALLLESFKSLRVLYVLAHFPWLKYLGNLVVDNSSIQKRKEYLTWVSVQVKKRIDRETARPDFMTLILANNGSKGVKLSRAEIDSNASLMLNAGSETTASLLSAATWLLLKNPVAMQRLKNEIRGKFGKYDDITLTAVSEIPYLSACLYEALRLFPPVPVGFGRVVNRGGEYVSGLYIPESTVVSVSHYAAYHSERNFKDADSFVPERWLGDESYAGDNKATWQPFSFGPRSCLGRNLAYAEMRLIMTKILWSFDLELDQRSYDWLSRCRVMRLWVKPQLAVRLKEVARS